MTAAPPPSPIEGYYRLHARIYDATRWSFLFGRTAILDDIAAATIPARILEVGCGTGKNLLNLAQRFPQAAITGVDLSETMLAVAQKKVANLGDRVTLVHRAYDGPVSDPSGFDLVLFSYALSMFNPGFEEAVTAAQRDLVAGGHIAVVDFHDTAFPIFASWMRVNHVRMEGQLLPPLQAHFTPVTDRVHRAYGAVWRYLMFVGRKS
jgi:S-adenosylmethionine-diacylgycerolhomoserine-N-methlytransferase